VSRRRGRTVEVDSLEEFTALVDAGARRMDGWRLQGLDLTGHGTELRRLDPAGSLFLGVALGAADVDWLRTHGALVFPQIPQLPFDPYRSELYAPDELYAGISRKRYVATPDAEIWAWSRQSDRDPTRALSRSLHDHAIDDALDQAVTGRRCVGVMGGHAVERGDARYRQAVELGRSLTRGGLLVLSGGGPGAMEAANLGAYLSTHDDDAMSAATKTLGHAPGFRPSITRWARAAFEVRETWPEGGESLGIPTWFYGHEPPNAFASGIAKFFRNALREDTLLSRCDAGIVFLPGAAGTVQEIFQDACENYYADASTVAPMVLVGTEHWSRQVPVWPLLTKLAAERAMEDMVFLVDSPADAVRALSDPL
jgi:predicted Rossmann-fold nucleotide-binding protein